jgi:predicted nucleic acid-binding Zn ribbon protein
MFGKDFYPRRFIPFMPIVPHRHCVVCGKAIEADKFVCSEECQEKLDKERKRQRNFTIFMFALLIIVLIILWLPFLR